jgi:hypothetical protein
MELLEKQCLHHSEIAGEHTFMAADFAAHAIELRYVAREKPELVEVRFVVAHSEERRAPTLPGQVFRRADERVANSLSMVRRPAPFDIGR